MVEARTPTRSERTKKRSGAATVKAALWALAPRRLREWKRRRMTARALWQAMEGLTLNSVGPIYCVKRLPGESNKSYKRRICKAARTIDTVNVSGWKPPQAAKPDAGRSTPPPATGARKVEIPAGDFKSAKRPTGRSIPKDLNRPPSTKSRASISSGAGAARATRS